MDFTTQVDNSNFNKILNFFNQDIADKVIKKVTNSSALDFDNKAAMNLKERIYDKPPSPHYERTGAALGGHIINPIDQGKKITFDSSLKPHGVASSTWRKLHSRSRKSTQDQAKGDHTKFLESNNKIPKLNTHFFSDAFIWLRQKVPGDLKTQMDNLLRQLGNL